MNNEEKLEELFKQDIEIQDALSYSRLSDFDRNGPRALIKRSNVSGEGVKIGSITDDLLLPAEGFVFEDNYIICDFEKPTATLGKLVDIILENYTEVPTKQTILDICKKNNFWKRSKDDTIIANFDTKDFWEYINIYIQGSQKAIITESEYNKGQDLRDRVKTHNFTKHLFEDDLETINQYKFKFKYKGIILRGIIDILKIDHKNKTIRFIDLKTGKNEALDFSNSFIKYRYYLQESVYTKAFKDICKELGLKDYKLLPFQFLYIGRSEQIPILYTVSKKWHKAALKGFNIGKYTYKGLDELLDDIKWHYHNNEFEAPRRIYEQQGNIILDDDFIELK